jgi:purine-binding chemotaxis protein CheW
MNSEHQETVAGVETERAVAPTAERGSSKDEMRLVTFALGDEEFGFNIMSVKEIIRVPKIAHVPMSPPHVDGVANLRGTVLPIVDMRTRFGMKRTEDTDRTRVLVIDENGVKTGLRVDRVMQVTGISRENIEPAPPAIGEASSAFIDGVVKLDGGKRIIMALQAGKVCQINGGKSETTEARGPIAGNAGRTVGETGEHNDRAQADLLQMVTFRVAHEEFGFPIELVREILRVETPRPLPEAPTYILGVLTVRGRLLPIIDLRCLLNQEGLAEGIVRECQTLRSALEQWSQAWRAHAENAAHPRSDDAPLEALRKWFNERNSSSQNLMESVAHCRAGIERIAKLLTEFSSTRAQIKDVLSWYDHEVGSQLSGVTREMVKFESMIVANIQEDQRIIVVDANGTQLGLVVDHVNEVLKAPKDCIDPPPTIGDATGLSGIAKLKDGTRLIMMLDSTKLLKQQIISHIKEIAGSNGSGSTQTELAQASKDRGRDLGERQTVTFRLGEEEFGIPISQIREIDRYSQITKVPKMPHCVEGVTNLRGEVVTVIGLRERFGMPDHSVDDRTRVIIVDLAGKKTGLRVDSVSQVLNIADRDIEAPPDSINGGEKTRFISGIAKANDGKRMIVLLDIAKILDNTALTGE